MSEFSNKREEKLKILNEFALTVIKNDNVLEHFKKIRHLIDNHLEPLDVVDIVDFLARQNIPMPQLKNSINKLLNLFYKAISKYKNENFTKNSFLWYLSQNNKIVEKKLNDIKPFVKQINKQKNYDNILNELISKLEEIESFFIIYTIKENILFPAIEKQMENYRCIQIMWSFHDDIRRNTKDLLLLLENKIWDLKKFNKLTADIFFNLRAITFRDNNILFPVIDRIIPKKEFDSLLTESQDFEFPFLKAKYIKQNEKSAEMDMKNNIVKLPTGNLTVEQLSLIFNHLPVDITYVDENNKVKYFSQPKSRIFPRTIAVIGRDVKNCHPPESVHIVEKIVENFRTGKKDEAVFWLKIKEKFIVIKYFAIRDANNVYRGVLEVSQEVNDIKKMQGQQRLLDWE